MSVALTELCRFLQASLQPSQYKDYCPNGLQVEGRPAVARLATGVTACQRFLDEAIEWGADALLVHHGYFWRGEAPQVVGMKRRRLATLLNADVSLLAYHLPLDAHPELGNNACLGRLMGIELEDQEPLEPGLGGIGLIGNLPQAMPANEFVARLEDITGRESLHVGDPLALVHRLAWCTGAAQEYIDRAVEVGADMFVTGEASEQTVHTAREEGIHFVAAGHHATERFGVQALGEHVATQFSLEHKFFDIDNPV
ncbi:MAG: Nif3-like dinuclear metal center hexameric protein [Halioglobus sp.]|jgi:dinuclear metal center YbgI/SA1388 family protein|nr:Nif3-like dinuclear metal center hexameric protein [Halioglobus sp.]